MKKLLFLCLLLCLGGLAASAQKKFKPWNEWSEKDALKMLNDSPWGQTQTDTNTSEMFFSPTSDRARNASRDQQGAMNQAVNLNFRIRFLSAKPIRQAIARQISLKTPQMEEQMKGFAEQTSDQYIVVAVDYDSTDRRMLGPAMQAFTSANVGILKNNTYLESKDGKRIFLDKYMPPSSDGLGAKFVFPRQVEGKPFVTPDSGYLRFYTEIPNTSVKLNMRFKIQDMTYDGKLEY
ncbi:MAG: hypothetical protein U0X75_16695 [Acidobacteriota bacterium]